MEYVSFLRGVNASGDGRFLRGELRAMFERMGFQDVHTFQGCSNIRFASEIKNEAKLSSMIQDHIFSNFGQEIEVITRRCDYLEKLIADDPFASYSESKDGQFYISFLLQPTNLVLKLPYRTQEGNLEIPFLTRREIFSIVKQSEYSLDEDAITSIERKFGNDLTTRKWDTVLKILSE